MMRLWMHWMMPLALLAALVGGPSWAMSPSGLLAAASPGGQPRNRVAVYRDAFQVIEHQNLRGMDRRNLPTFKRFYEERTRLDNRVFSPQPVAPRK